MDNVITGLMFIVALMGIILLIYIFIYVIVRNRKSKTYLIRLFVGVAFVGAVIYMLGYLPFHYTSFSEAFFTVLSAVPRTILSVAKMFLASDDYEAIKGLHKGLVEFKNIDDIFSDTIPLYTKIYFLIFWLIHGLAVLTFYAAILSVFQEKLMYRIRLLLNFSKDIYVIFGVSEQSLYFAESLIVNNKRAQTNKKNSSPLIIFLDEEVVEGNKHRIFNVGGVLITDKIANESGLTIRLAKLLGLEKSIFFKKNRKIANYHIYSFTDNDQLNYDFIVHMIDYIYKENYQLNKVQLYFKMEDSIYMDEIEKYRSKGRYNKDEIRVKIFSESELAAYDLINSYPVYNAVEIKDGFATKPLTIIIIGAGDIGIKLLKELIQKGQFFNGIRNGNFNKNNINIFVIDKNAEAINTQFKYRYPQLIQEYNFTFVQANALNGEYVPYIINELQNVQYITISLGDDFLNTSVALDLSELFGKMELDKDKHHILAHIRDKDDTKFCIPRGIKKFGAYKDIFTKTIMIDEDREKLAIFINELYNAKYEAEQRISSKWNIKII